MGWRCAPLPGTISPTSTNPLGPGRRVRGPEKYSRQPRPSAREISLRRTDIRSGPVEHHRNGMLSRTVLQSPESACLQPMSSAPLRTLLLILANLELSSAFVIPVDDDIYDMTNLNRCPLAGWQDVDHPKVDASQGASRRRCIEVLSEWHNPVLCHECAYWSSIRCCAARRSELHVVVSCVDKGISRQDIQGLEPHLLFGGSTDLQAKANWYTGRLGSACLACFNPAERNSERSASGKACCTMPAGRTPSISHEADWTSRP